MTEDPLLAALNAIEARCPTLAPFAEIVSDPGTLRDESPVSLVARSLVAVPGSVPEVSCLMRLASELRIPVVPRGARTGLVGGAVPGVPSIVIDVSRLTEIETLDVSGRYLRIGAGATLGRIDEILAEHGMMYPPDPASFRRATIGGTAATNAGGLRCVKYGTTQRWIRTLQVVLMDGAVMELGHPVVKDATGYNLTGLFVGSEGTLGIITSVGVGFCPRSENEQLLLVAFATVADALLANRAIQDRLTPSMCELLDRGALESRDTAALLPLLGDSGAWGEDPTLLMVQVDGSDAAAELVRLQHAVAPHQVRSCVVPAAHIEAVLSVRRGGSAVRTGGRSARRTQTEAEEALVAPSDPAPSLPQDLSVPIDRMREVVRAIREIADRLGIQSRIAAHAGDGNMHLLLVAPEGQPRAAATAALREAMSVIIDVALAAGGTVSGEHGIGSAKREWSRRDLGSSVTELHRRIKLACDPDNLMNPGKAF